MADLALAGYVIVSYDEYADLIDKAECLAAKRRNRSHD